MLLEAEQTLANDRSLFLELVTVILAAALFMLGVAGVLRYDWLRVAFFTIGALFFFGGVIQILRISVF